MRSSNGWVCSWFQWPPVVLSYLPVFLSSYPLYLSSHLLYSSFSLSPFRSTLYEKAREEAQRTRKKTEYIDGEKEREKQVVRGSSMRETFGLVERISLILSVPLLAYKRNEACQRRTLKEMSDRDELCLFPLFLHVLFDHERWREDDDAAGGRGKY